MSTCPINPVTGLLVCPPCPPQQPPCPVGTYCLRACQPVAHQVPTLTGAGLIVAIIALAVITAIAINPKRTKRKPNGHDTTTSD